MKIIIIIFSLICWEIQAQTISYFYQNNTALLKYDLKIDEKNQLSSWERTINVRGEKVRPIIDFVKNKETFYLKDKSVSGRYNIQEIPLLVWKEEKEKAVILGYKCLSAATTFRGRTYTAYYTPEIKLSYGPWKFSGLMGLILEVKSDDGNYVFKAEKIDLSSKNDLKTEVAYFLQNNSFISWEKYTQQYEKDLYQHIENQKCNCSKDGTNILKISKIEKIIPNLHDTGIPY